MKKLMKVLIIIMLFLMTSTQFVYAEGEDAEEAISTQITGDDFINQFKPGEKSELGIEGAILNPVMSLVNSILGIVQVVGVVMTVISVAFFGFRIIMSNSSELLKPLGVAGGLGRQKEDPGDNAQVRHWMWLVLIGSVLLFLSSTIVRIVFKILF